MIDRAANNHWAAVHWNQFLMPYAFSPHKKGMKKTKQSTKSREYMFFCLFRPH